ncbi:MAG: hydroxyacid dehydrogenase, partial [Chloroflexi bacterium]|nr:hydroxyacid dehydrogenase [Chloroflexota bacterium]
MSMLDALPPPWGEDLLPRIREAIGRSGRRLVALDDDPTGTQTVYDVPVLTGWSEQELAAGLAEDWPALYVLTNSRSLPEDEAVTLAREVGHNLARAARGLGVEVAAVSRSDSTLRGHYPAEVWALRDALAEVEGRPFDGEVLAPFFEEGGRLTISDVHYVQQGERLVPAGETEFARDAAFGYRASNLAAWIEEKSGGRVSAGAAVSVSIEMVRTGGPERVAELLQSVSGGAPVIVNAATYRDLEVFVLGLLLAEAEGKRFIYRTGASFVRVRAGLAARPTLRAVDLYPAGASPSGGLTIVGSHVRRTTEQLEEALRVPGVAGRELVVDRILDPATRDEEVAGAAAWAEGHYVAGEDVLLYTSREVVAGDRPEASLRVSQTVSAALVDLVRRLQAAPRYLIAKGGITSSDLATRGLGVRRAIVRGQVSPGIPCWALGPESRFPDLPYV